MKSTRKPQIAVVGGSDPTPDVRDLAKEVGRTIASLGSVLICGGLGGVMEAAAQGAKESGGLTIGIIPDYATDLANPYIDVVIGTGLGHARNVVVVASAALVVALPGSHGTRSEVSIGLRLARPVIGLRSWREIEGVHYVENVEELRKTLMPYF